MSYFEPQKKEGLQSVKITALYKLMVPKAGLEPA